MSPRARRTAMVLLTTIYGFGFVDRVVIGLVAQSLKADFGISDLDIGLLSGTAFAVVNTLAAVPLARIAERHARRWVVIASVAVGSLFTALCAATGSFGQLLVLRLGMAAGSAGTEAPAHSMISDMYAPARRTSALSLFMLGVPIASLVGSYVGGGIAQAYGWRATFLAFGLPGLVTGLVAAALLREPARAAPSEQSGAGLATIAASLWRRPEFRHILFGTALVSLGSFGTNTFLPSYFARNFALGPAQSGLLFGLVSGLASGVGSLIGGYGSERLARRSPGWLIGVPGIGLVVGAPLLVLGVTRPVLAEALPIILLGSCFFYMAMGPAIATMHGLLDSRSRATGSALFMLFVHMVGQGIGPALAGLASDRFAAWQFGSADFARACAGAAGQVPGSACAVASALGVRTAIAAFALIYLWAALHFALAARRTHRGDPLAADQVAPPTAAGEIG